MVGIIPPRRGQELTPDGKATIRFQKYLEDLADQTNENTDTLNITLLKSLTALVFDLSRRIGSGNALTSDETGFTVDLDLLSVDMDEA